MTALQLSKDVVIRRKAPPERCSTLAYDLLQICRHVIGRGIMGISSVSNASSLPPAASNAGTYKVIDLATTLTADDKQIVKAATGYEIGQTKAVPHLADAIAISRSLGTLQGPVTSSFLQKYASNPEIGATAINKALAFLSNNISQHQSTSSSGLSITV